MDVTRNDEDRRFEFTAEGTTAFLAFHITDGQLFLDHTEVPRALEGAGVGSKLVRAALAHARTERLPVVAICPFVASYLERHPDETVQF